MTSTHNEQLSINDLSKVRAELFEVREKWYNIGTDLGLTQDTLEKIQQNVESKDPNECLLRMLLEWLKATDLSPTWRKLSKAVQQSQVVDKAVTGSTTGEENDGMPTLNPSHVPVDSGDSATFTPSPSPSQLPTPVSSNLPPLPTVQNLSQNPLAVPLSSLHTEDKIISPLDQPLSTDDLSKVRGELFQVQVKWYDIGLDLGLPVNTLETIRQECQDLGECLRKMILEWLKAVDLQPTWRKLVDVLQNRVINEGVLAIKITQDYNIPSPTLSASPTPIKSNLPY